MTNTYKFATEELLRAMHKDPLIQVVIELKSKRIAAQQVNRLKGDNKYEVKR